jgi:hypothetical protein
MAVAKSQGKRTPSKAVFATALMGVVLLFSYALSVSRRRSSSAAVDPNAALQQTTRGGGGNKEWQALLETRVCGSPAVDGYAHVKPECLEGSPTNQWWQQHKPTPDDLDVHIERAADYDGLAGGYHNFVAGRPSVALCTTSAKWQTWHVSCGLRRLHPLKRLQPGVVAAVGWGIGNTKASIEECAEACRQHVPKGPSIGELLPPSPACLLLVIDAPYWPPAASTPASSALPDPLPPYASDNSAQNTAASPPPPAASLNAGPFGNLPCNAFAFCAFDTCFEPDAHSHRKGDCWLKFTEAPASPEVNMRGRLPLALQQRHPAAPKEVQWHAGVLLPHGVTLTNGSWSPRHSW